MTYLAFARKYRPKTFEDVVGQEAIAQALRGAVASGRTASVYLFSGSHGVGKTSMARILAKALECPNAVEGRPCLTCELCQSIDRGEAFDVLEIDAASNRSVDDAERIRQNVRTRGSAKFKIYILDEVHQLSRTAFDALLKTFEEAPEHVRFILATTELHKVPPTIRSRAQVFHFHRSTREAIEGRLAQIAQAEGVPIAPPALTLIARRARGSMRDAQKLLDQAVGLSGDGAAGRPEGAQIQADDVANLLGTLAEERVERVLGALARAAAGPLLEELDDYLARGGRPGTFIEDLQEAMRAVLYYKACGPGSPLLEEVAYDPEHLRPVAEALGEEAILYALTILQEAEVKMRTAREPRILLEVCLVRMARMAELRPLGEVLARLERLEAALLEGGPPARAAGDRPDAPVSPRPAPAPAPAPPAAPRSRLPQDDGPRAAPPQPPPQGAASRFDPAGPPPRRGYAYPASMAPGAAATRPSGAPAPPARPGGAPDPAPAPELTARQVVELDRAARLDRPASPAAPSGPVALSPPVVEAAWHEVQGPLREALGIGAAQLDKYKARVLVEQGDVVLEVDGAIPDFSFGQLAEQKTVDTIARFLGGPLGAPPRVRLRKAAKVEGAGATGPVAGAAPTPGPQQRPRSVYDDPLVRQAQRELAATPLTREE